MNPEHPPLVKLLATSSLLNLHLKVPIVQKRYFKEEAFLDGRDFLFENNADQILWRTRMTILLLTVSLGLLIFVAGREMFGPAVGLIALAFFVFDPNVLAHGAVVTTDMGVTLFMFGAIYSYYRYLEKPSIKRLMLVGVLTGLAFAAKHSAILLVPTMVLLGITELVRLKLRGKELRKPALSMMGQVLVVSVVSVLILWAFYGFRYDARPGRLAMTPSLQDWVGRLPKPSDRAILSSLARWHALPESYLYGLADVRSIAAGSHSYLLGNIYPHGVWFYFPVAFVIKCTIPVLIMAALIIIAFWRGWIRHARKIAFLVLPPVLYFAQAMFSGLNIGVRHILPIFPYLFLLGAASLWALVQRDRRLGYAVAALLVVHAVSGARSFPNYLAYSNEVWGGPAKTYKYLTDSNVDWAQQLKQVRQYLDSHNIKECWFAYVGDGVVDSHYYGVNCRPLPTVISQWLGGEQETPPSIDGTVLISAETLSGYSFLPEEPNPYDDFKKIKPVAQIGYGVFVYQGHFDIPVASAYYHARQAELLLDKMQTDEGLKEAKLAATLAPEAPRVKKALKRAEEMQHGVADNAMSQAR